MKRFMSAAIAVMLTVALCSTAFAGSIIVAHDTNFKPFEFKQDGKYTGFDIELWEAIAAELKLDYKTQPMDFNGIIPGLQTGSVDVGIAGMTIKPSREKVVDFSQPYYDSGLVILVRADNTDINSIEDLKGKTIATKLATSSADFAKEKIPSATVTLFPSNENMFMELVNGAADAVIFDLPVCQEYAMSPVGKGKVKVTGPLYSGQSYGIAFPKGSELRDKVDTALTTLKQNGVYEKLYIKWFGKAPAAK